MQYQCFMRMSFTNWQKNLESDLYILPSSVHEVLAVSTELTEPEELAQMVAEVNMQKVALEERLSNQVYHYDKDLRETHTCNGYTEQETGRYRGRAAACI